MGIFAGISGLNRLVEKYLVKEYPEGKELVRQTVQFGLVRYRNCVTVIINIQGLYLKVSPPLSSSSEMLIPWDEIKRISHTRLYGSKAIQLSLGFSGKDNLIVYNELFELIQSYLIPNRYQDNKRDLV